MHDKLKTQRSWLVAVIVIVVTCGGVGAFAVLVGRWSGMVNEVIGTTATVGIASLLMLICAATWIRRRWFPLGPLGCAANVLSVGLLMVVIWGHPRRWGWYDYEELVVGFCFFSAGLAHANLLALADLRREFRWVRRATIVAAGILVGLVALAYLVRSASMLWGQCVGIAAIAVVCGTIAVGILHRLSKIKNQQSTRTFDFSVSLVCPRCAASAEISVGHSRCPSCGLRFNLEIDEEQCDGCGYPLYKLTSDRCPECGTRT